MPQYKSTNDLPEDVQDYLPEHAQHIYRQAFNSAWEQYARSDKRKKGRTREETAHAVAWSAVKSKYKKGENGDWVKK